MIAVNAWSIACCTAAVEMEETTDEIMMMVNGEYVFLKIQGE